MRASIAQWQSVGLVNQRSWVQSSLEAVFLYRTSFNSVLWKKILTPTWFEHAAFWSGVRRATVAPRSQLWWGPTEIWTRIAGFKVQSANHYTIGPDSTFSQLFLKPMYHTHLTYWQKDECFLPGSNRRPCACEAHVITATLRKLPDERWPHWWGGLTDEWRPHINGTGALKKHSIPSGGRTQDLWIRSPTRYPLR
jgi:hypothetical protein